MTALLLLQQQHYPDRSFYVLIVTLSLGAGVIRLCTCKLDTTAKFFVGGYMDQVS